MSEGALQRSFEVVSELGLHARPAGEFARIVARFSAEVHVARGEAGEWVNGLSVLDLLSLAAGQGALLRVRARGPEARQALDAIGELPALAPKKNPQEPGKG